MGDEHTKSCCSCTGAGIALGFFSLGLFIVIATALVLAGLLWSVPAIVVLVISSFLVLIVLIMIWKLLSACLPKHEDKDC
ncbi:hypothetical protein [Bacillus solimangrovi]|uniref:Uncharacterized protein n=1 Tax=Bacillus solimangrovi TaxID=1305675 RepID=A0A1E5LJJ8_9BACI|nr:hypothetical protein [Bacillus solimangrovi]OEH94260.1 hypothetical protein BFG57_08355 [Bacillus solimangrovi]